MNLTHPESLIFWTVIVFVILFVLLRKFAWKPILSAVNTRESKIEEALESAKKAREEMANLQADNEKMLAEARAERDAMLKEAREIKDKIIADAKEAAATQGAAILEQAKAEIETEKRSALAELKNQVAHLSLDIAQKVVKEELSDDAKQLQQVEKMLNDVTLN